MIKYTSKDIIERAEQLADLQNSDFISDSEKSALLNECWLALYQKIINANDRTFIKTISAYDGLTLPKDFFQLSALYVTKDKRQIERINAAQMRGYSLTNNTLLLSHEYEDIDITLEYYPTPKTIFYNPNSKDLRSFSSSPVMILDDSLYINTSGDICDYDNNSVIESAIIDGLRFKNGCVSLEGAFTTYNGETIETRTTTPFIVKGNEVTYDIVKSDLDLSDYAICFMDEAEQNCYFLSRDGVLFDRNFNALFDGEELESVESCLFYCREDGLYMAYPDDSKYIIRILGEVVEHFTLNLFTFCCFVDSDFIISSFNDKFYKQTYGFNTLFDTPNNLYFTLMTYALAISFKMKQQGDITQLSTRYENECNQFFDSLQRDANQPYTMKNVYQNGRGRTW